MPIAVKVMPHVPPVHVTVWQSVVVPGQLDGLVHPPDDELVVAALELLELLADDTVELRMPLLELTVGMPPKPPPPSPLDELTVELGAPPIGLPPVGMPPMPDTALEDETTGVEDEDGAENVDVEGRAPPVPTRSGP